MLDESRLQLLRFLEDILPGITAAFFIASVIYFIRLVYKLRSESHGSYSGSNTKFGTEEKIGVGIIASTSYILSGSILALPATFGLFWLAYWLITKYLLKKAESTSSDEKSVLDATDPEYKNEQAEGAMLNSASTGGGGLATETKELGETQQHEEALVGSIAEQAALAQQELSEEDNWDKKVHSELEALKNVLSTSNSRLDAAQNMEDLEKELQQILSQSSQQFLTVLGQIGKDFSQHANHLEAFTARQSKLYTVEAEAIRRIGTLSEFEQGESLTGINRDGESILLSLKAKSADITVAIKKSRSEEIKATLSALKNTIDESLTSVQERVKILDSIVTGVKTALKSVGTAIQTVSNAIHNSEGNEKKLAGKRTWLRETALNLNKKISITSGTLQQKKASAVQILASQDSMMSLTFSALKEFTKADIEVWGILKELFSVDKGILENMLLVENGLAETEQHMQKIPPVIIEMAGMAKVAGVTTTINADQIKMVATVITRAVQRAKTFDVQKTNQAIQSVTALEQRCQERTTRGTEILRSMDQNEQDIRKMLGDIGQALNKRTKKILKDAETRKAA